MPKYTRQEKKLLLGRSCPVAFLQLFRVNSNAIRHKTNAVEEDRITDFEITLLSTLCDNASTLTAKSIAVQTAEGSKEVCQGDTSC